MTLNAPQDHLDESQQITADALVSLFEITLNGTPNISKIYFTDGKTTTWRGKQYEAITCKISGVSRSADDSKSRPTLTVVNPIGMFSGFAFAGYFDGANLIRKRVLLNHLNLNIDLSQVNYWYISRVKEMIAGQSLTFELRSLTDGPDHFLPARKYIPPEFPFVTL